MAAGPTFASAPLKKSTGPNLSFPFRTSKIPFEEGIMHAQVSGRVLAPNSVLDEASVQTGAWAELGLSGHWAWSGTLTAHTESGMSFGDKVVYTVPKGLFTYVFPVPEQFRGERGLLVVEHPHYTLGITSVARSGLLSGTRLIGIPDASQVHLLPLPEPGGWYLPDPVHGIPVGERSDESNPDARFLWYLPESARIGPVSRCHKYEHGQERFVGLGYSPREAALVPILPSANELPVQ